MGTVSKALEKSRVAMSVCRPTSYAFVKSYGSLSRFLLRLACCYSGILFLTDFRIVCVIKARVVRTF